MRNLKKVLALVLALVMAMSLVTIASAKGASDFSDYGDITYKEAVDVMTAVGVFDGVGGNNFAPTNSLTREQAAKIVTYMLMGQANADKLVATIAPYSDVDASRWSAGSIAYCDNVGILAGVGDGKFNPTGELTGLAFAKMLLVALGYDAEIENLIGSKWAINAATLATATGLTDGMEDVSLSEVLTREQACQMAFNAMKTPLVEYENKGATIEVNGATVSFGAGKATYVTTTIAKTQTISDTKLSNSNEYTIEFAEQYCQDLVLDDETNALEQPVNEWTYKNEIIGQYAVEADSAAVVADKDKTINDILTGSSYMDYSSKKIDVGYRAASGDGADDSAHVYVNGVQKALATALDTVLTKGDVVYAYENSNGDVYKVVVASYTYAKIDTVATNMSATEEDNGAAYRLKLVDIDGNNIGTYYDSYDAASKLEIADFDADAYEEGVVLAVAVNATTKDIVSSYVAEAVTGKPTAVQEIANGSISIDGAKYNYAGTPAGPYNSIDFDKEYTVYTTADGYVIAIDGASAANVEDIYYVASIYNISTAGETVYYAQRVSSTGVVDTVKVEEGALQVIAGNSTLTSTNYGKTSISDGAAAAGLYTFHDKKVAATSLSSGTSVEQKAGNEVYTIVPFNSNADVKADFTLKADSSAGSVSMEVSDPSYTTDAGKVYFDENTLFVSVEGQGTGIDVATATGGMKVSGTAKVYAVVTNDDGKTAKLVYVAGSSLTVSNIGDNVVYLAGNATEKNSADTYITDKIWFMNDLSNPAGIVITDDNIAQGFYTYGVENDIYELGNESALSLSAAYDGEKGFVEDLIVSSVYGSRSVSFTATHFTGDIAFNGVTIIDTRSAAAINSSLYPTEITTIGDLKDAVSAAGGVVVDAFFDDGVTFIAVTGLTNTTKLPTSSADYAAAEPGVYTGTGDALTAVGVTNTAGTENVIVFKFNAPAITSKAVILTIKDSGDSTYYSETHSAVTWATAGSHQFFLNTDDCTYNGADATTSGTWASADGAIADGTYTYTITVDGATVLSGTFVIG